MQTMGLWDIKPQAGTCKRARAGGFLMCGVTKVVIPSAPTCNRALRLAQSVASSSASANQSPTRTRCGDRTCRSDYDSALWFHNNTVRNHAR